MDATLVVRGVLAGLVAALLASPLGLGWLSDQVDPTGSHAWPLLPCLLVALLAPAPLVWAGARTGQGAASRRDALLRGAVSGTFGGVVLFLVVGGPVAGILALRPALAGLARAPLQGLDLGVTIAQSITQLIALCSALWLGLPVVGAGLGALGAGRWRAETAGALRGPGLDSMEASLGALLLALVAFFVRIPISTAMRSLGGALGDLGVALQDGGETVPWRPWAIEIPSYLTYAVTLMAFLALIRGVELRQVGRIPRGVWTAPIAGGVSVPLQTPFIGTGLGVSLVLPYMLMFWMAIMGAWFAIRSARKGAVPTPDGSSAFGWMLATATALAWCLSLSVHIGLAAGLGVVALISPLASGTSVMTLGVRSPGDLACWMPACGLLLLPAQGAPVLLFMGIPLGVRAFLRRRAAATSSRPSP